MEQAPTITIFTDFTNPAAYVTESALRALGRDVPLAIEYRALELHPAPSPAPTPDAAAGEIARVEAAAREEGLTLRPPGFVPRTRKAHEASMFAAEHGKGDEMRDAIYRAYWGEGLDIGRIDVLTALGADIGFDPADVKIALDIDRFSDAVARDSALAARLGIHGVPALYIGSGPGAVVMAGVRTRSDLASAIPTR